MQSKIDSLEEIKAETRVYGGENPVSIYLWLALIALAFALVFALFRTRVAIKEASYRIELYDQLFEELRENRIKATEREKKLGRELQTERNRVEELLEKGNNIN
jgi:cell division protein FtsL